MKPIRVRAFYTRYPHWGAHSGFYQILRNIDASTAVVSPRPVSDSDEDWPLPESVLNARLRQFGVRRGMAWYKLSDLTAELSALPACLLNTVDIVHFLDAEHTGQFLQTWLRFSRLSRVRTIGTFHQPPEVLRGLVNADAIRALDLALAVSPTQVSFLRDFLPKGRVRVLLHGVDTTFFHPKDRRETSPGFRCITTGHWLRDWPAIGAAAEMLLERTDIEFHVVTNRETGIEGLRNIRFHRNIDDEVLRNLYQDADVMLLPLTNATANNSLLEGLACGLPLISTPLPAVRAYVDDQSALLIDNNEPAALVRGILQLLEDGRRRAAMSRAARARAESLALPRVARELEEVYLALYQRRLSVEGTSS